MTIFQATIVKISECDQNDVWWINDSNQDIGLRFKKEISNQLIFRIQNIRLQIENFSMNLRM